MKILYRMITGLLLAGWMILIFSFSAQPAVESDKVSGTVAYRIAEGYGLIFHMELTKEETEHCAKAINYPIRKAAHMTEYAILGLLSFAYCLGYRKQAKSCYLLALGISAAYAAADEIHQIFVPGRAGRFSDVCIDTAGAALALILLYLILKIAGKHCEKKKVPLQ